MKTSCLTIRNALLSLCFEILLFPAATAERVKRGMRGKEKIGERVNNPDAAADASCAGSAPFTHVTL